MSRSKNFISLAEHNPELIAEWHPTLNGDLKPTDVSYGSAIKVWWLGACGHEWIQNPNHRSRGRGCPICADVQRAITRRKNIVVKRGSLAENNPKLASEWHPTKNGSLTPYDVSSGSGDKAWWICEKGHEWEAQIASRNIGCGCPTCAGDIIEVGFNDLATVRPDIAAQWHPTLNGDLKPSNVTVRKGINVYWICEEGHIWNAKISNRTDPKQPTNCPVCSGKKVLVGYNDLATKRPDLALEWHPTKNGDKTPEEYTTMSNAKIWWFCYKGHEWEASIDKRTIGERCPICFGESKTSFPEQAIFYYLSKYTVAYNRYKTESNIEIDVFLPEYNIGIEYDGAYYHKGEPAKKRENNKNNQLEQMGITLIRIKETKNLTSVMDIQNTIYSKAGYSDEELTTTIKELISLVSKKINTTIDINVDVSRDRIEIYEQYVLSEKDSSLLIKNPILAKEWNYNKNGVLQPDTFTLGSNKKVWWICDKGHEWEATINSRNKGAGCPECYKEKRKRKI